MLDRAPRNATVTATSTLEALVFPEREFAEAIRGIPALADRLLKGLARRIRAVEGPVGRA